MMKVLLLPAALFLFPVLLGLPWTRLLPERRLLKAMLCWPLGYFLALALFEIVAVPFIWLRGSFFILAPVYSGLLAAAGMISLTVTWISGKKMEKSHKGMEKEWKKGSAFHLHISLNYWEWLYLLSFLVLVLFQVIRAVTWDMTFMNYDDYDYLVRATDAITHGSLLGINPNTGLAQSLSMKRSMQGFLLFPAWLSWISGLPVTTLARTVLEALHTLMTYVIFAGMAMVLFQKRENGLIFLFLLSLLFLMGHYSHYSPTFRLLGPNYQGKGTLAVVFSPLLFTLMLVKVSEAYDQRFGLLLLLFSIAAISMTLFGALIMVADVGLPVVLSLFRKPRIWKNNGYILWASVFPAACGVAYLLLR